MLQVKELDKQIVGKKVKAWDGLGEETRQWGKILRLAMLAQDEHASAHAQLEGPRGGRAPVTKPGCTRRTWLAGYLSSDRVGVYEWQELPQRDGGIVPTKPNHYSILVQYVKNYL